MKEENVEKIPVVRLRARRNSLHPWIFRNMVRFPARRLESGELVQIENTDGSFVGYGFFNAESNICLRVLSTLEKERVDGDFLKKRLAAAREFREKNLRILEQTNSYRLVHSEGDGLSGLIIDKIGQVFVVEVYSAGWVWLLSEIETAIEELFGPSTIYVRPGPMIESKEKISFSPSWLGRGKKINMVEVIENGARFRVDIVGGQKTGFFLDQRENRAFFAELAKGKKVLDICSYTGGFSITSLVRGAVSSVGVDVDSQAIERAKENARMNCVEERAEYLVMDGFEYMRKAREAGEKFEIVVTDPSKFARVKEEIPRAMKAYNDLNRLAMELLPRDGILLSCSCSGLISERDFVSIICGAARELKRTLQIFKIAGAASDHPFTNVFPEGKYLKAVFCRLLD